MRTAHTSSFPELFWPLTHFVKKKYFNGRPAKQAKWAVKRKEDLRVFKPKPEQADSFVETLEVERRRNPSMEEGGRDNFSVARICTFSAK